MKTTLILHPEVAEALRSRARQEGRSMSSIAEEALSAHLSGTAAEPAALDLPQFDLGAPLVDVADRNVLFETLDQP